MTSSNRRLDRIEMRAIFADGESKLIELEARLQAVIAKLLAMRAEIEDQHTCQVVLHLGRRGDVKADVSKRY